MGQILGKISTRRPSIYSDRKARTDINKSQTKLGKTRAKSRNACQTFLEVNDDLEHALHKIGSIATTKPSTQKLNLIINGPAQKGYSMRSSFGNMKNLLFFNSCHPINEPYIRKVDQIKRSHGDGKSENSDNTSLFGADDSIDDSHNAAEPGM